MMMQLFSLFSKNPYRMIFFVALLLAIGASVLVYARNQQTQLNPNREVQTQAVTASDVISSALATSATVVPEVIEPEESIPVAIPAKKVSAKPSPVKEDNEKTDDTPVDEPTISISINEPLKDSEDNSITEIRVSKAQNMLHAYHDQRLVRSFPVATGANNCTPVGTYEVASKSKNPGGAFGSRWMGLNKHNSRTGRQYGLHGTNDPKSIGYQKSHGCVRLFNKDVEELFEITPEGTTVIIMDDEIPDL
ncbi:MAG: L,D-transpeptidase family protein [bacterium]